MSQQIYIKKKGARLKAEQLNLFTIMVSFAYLEAPESPRQAFYKIWIEQTDEQIKLVKESGVKGRVLDRRIWVFDDLDIAVKLFRRRIDQKVDPKRKSPRKYRLVLEV